MLRKMMILKKFPQQSANKTWKTALYLALLICWAVIIIGSFSLFN